jgi:dienelactone hydrolase
VLWNHGSEKLPGSRTDLAQFYTANGFVFFVPHRHGHGRSPGDYIVDLQSKAKAEAKDAAEFHLKVIALHELYLKDTIAALAWLKQQNFVDTNRIVMSGVSYGGIQTVLAAEKDLGVKAYLPFAPGAMSWQAMPELHDRLLKAVKQSHAPMFLLQAENDYNLGPSEVLGGELKRLGAPNQAKVYPPYGETHQSGHGAFACRGTNVWGADVLSFMKPLLEGARAGTQTARQ